MTLIVCYLFCLVAASSGGSKQSGPRKSPCTGGRERNIRPVLCIVLRRVAAGIPTHVRLRTTR